MNPHSRLEDLPDLLTVPQVAAYYGVSVVTVRRLIAAGRLTRIKVGRLDRIPRWSLAGANGGEV